MSLSLGRKMESPPGRLDLEAVKRPLFFLIQGIAGVDTIARAAAPMANLIRKPRRDFRELSFEDLLSATVRSSLAGTVQDTANKPSPEFPSFNRL